jgi:N6-adenosine-specific RNA methylase IME4
MGVKRGELVRYDAMCRAIAAAHRVDEVKGIRDKALALEEYARQARNEELEARCREIKERAEVRWSELYVGGVKAKGARGNPGGQGAAIVRLPAESAQTLAEMGVSYRQSVKWQARAGIPAAEREAMWAAGKSTDGLLKAERRRLQEAALAGRRTEPLGRGVLYQVIYADPPWRFEPYSRVTGLDRSADNHYPTLELDRIKGLGVPAAVDSVLFLWATAALLPAALEVMSAWGFGYKTHCVWVKDRVGTGYWFRSMHELLLVGTRGQIPAPAMGQRLPSVFEEAVGRHSEKPGAFAEFIEAWYPHLAKLELFGRRRRAGWVVWGNEVEGGEDEGEDQVQSG